MREIASMIIVLSLICAISGFMLSFLKENTAGDIEKQVLTYVQGPALKTVLTDYDNDPIADRKKFTIDGQEMMIFPAKKGGQLKQVAMETFGKGYGGDIGVIVGFNTADDTLAGIGITTLKETPGLGTRITEPKYTRQFRGKGLDGIELKSKGGPIDGVSGATFSSAGTVIAVNKAVDIYKNEKSKFQETWK